MTAKSPHRLMRLVLFLSVLIGFFGGAWLAQKNHTTQQDQWATQWLANQLEEVIPHYWMGPSEVENFRHINLIYNNAINYWHAFPAIAPVKLLSIDAPKPSTHPKLRGQYELMLADHKVMVTTLLPSFPNGINVWLKAAITLMLSLVCVLTAIRWLPKPYTAGKMEAIYEGFPSFALGHPIIENLFEKEINLRLLTKLLADQQDLSSFSKDANLITFICTDNRAAKLAKQCIDQGWEAENIYPLIKEAQKSSDFADAGRADYQWWKLLTNIHGKSPLEALRDSQKPQLMQFDLERSAIIIRGLEKRVAPGKFATLCYFAKRKLANEGALKRPNDKGDAALTESILEIYRDLPKSRDEDIGSGNITGTELGHMISHANRAIKEIIKDEKHAEFYCIQLLGLKKHDKRYEISCPVEIAINSIYNM